MSIEYCIFKQAIMFRGTKIMNRMLLLRGCLSPQEMDTLRSLVVLKTCSLLLITDLGKLICSQLHR